MNVPLSASSSSSSSSASPPDSFSPLVKQKRKRNRNGCVTVRKIKCDEGKPCCNRCTSTGRKCDGYQQTDAQPRNTKQLAPLQSALVTQRGRVEAIIRGIPSFLTGSSEDTRLLEIFHLRCLPVISGYAESKVWTRLIPQLSQREPIIWHGMLAIASSFEETETLGRPLVDNFPETQDAVISRPKAIAISHYTKALQGIQLQLGSGQSDPIIVLTACVVFTCMEALRGNTEAALTHIKNGSNILEDALKGDRRRSPGKSALSASDDIKDSLVFSFKRLRILSSSIQEVKRPSAASQRSIPGVLTALPHNMVFESLDEARYVQGQIMTNAALVVYGATQDQTTCQSGPDSAIADRIRVDAQLRQWTHAYDTFLEDKYPNLESKYRKSGLVILRFFTKLCSIRLWVSFLPPGPTLDALTIDFKELLDSADECTALQSRDTLQMSGKLGKPPLFVMDMGLLPGVFFAACKCPDLALRLRAIEMLERTPRREALWCSVTAARMARNVLNAGTTWPEPT